MNSYPDSYFSTTLEKGLIILSLFDRDHTSRRLSEISRITGINKTSVFRFVNTLIKLGFLRKSKINNLIHLGPRSFVLGQNFFHGFDILQSVKPILEKTFLEHKISIDSAILHEHSLISLYRREVASLIFLRLPLVMNDLHARAMGKAILANMDSAELSSFLENIQFNKLTSKTVLNQKALLKDLEQSKERGYSINNEEYIKGLICIGAPIFNYNTSKVIGAVSLDFPASDYSLDSIQKNFPRVLTKVASELSEAITSIDI